MKVNPSLVVGIVLVLLSLVTATGAVSLGPVQTYTTSNGTTVTRVTGLAYSPLYILLSLFLAGGGMALVYYAGREESTHSNQKQQALAC
jgi:uncharacterized membrane protein